MSFKLFDLLINICCNHSIGDSRVNVVAGFVCSCSQDVGVLTEKGPACVCRARLLTKFRAVQICKLTAQGLSPQLRGLSRIASLYLNESLGQPHEVL
jgi:hypothetical protein